MQTFAQQLNAIRKERHITQEQLAQEMNVSRTTISRWESGKALPDIETIKRLSQVLNYNFFTVEGFAEVIPAADAPADKAPAAPRDARRRGRGWLYAAGGLCLLCLCLFLMAGIVQKPSGDNAEAGHSPTDARSANGVTYSKDARAEIVVTPATEVAYLTPFGPDSNTTGYGWDVNFTFENRSDVPFTPEKVVASFYSGSELSGMITLPYEQLRPWMGNDKLLSINDPLNWPFGTDQLYLTHLTVTIYGTDDNGNRIESSATVQYSQEYADAAGVQ